MKRMWAVARGWLGCGVVCGVLMTAGGGPAALAAGPDDKKPVRKPVINLDGSAKQRRPGQVMPGDASPASSAAVPAKPEETPIITPSAAATPGAAPSAQPQAGAALSPAPSVPAAEPIPASTPRKVVAPPPKLHATAVGVPSVPAGAQVRRPGAVGAMGAPTDAAWADLSSSWGEDAPIEVRVGVHAPVVIRVAGATDASGAPLPATLVTLWPMARAMVGPELVDGRWVPGVRLTRGQATVQPESSPDGTPAPTTGSVAGGGWSSVVRTPERTVPIANAGGRVAYDPVRRTRSWTLMKD